MQARVDPEGWVASEGMPRFLAIQLGGTIVIDLVAAVLILAFPPLASVLGLVGRVTAVAFVFIAGFAGVAWIAQASWPKAVRAGATGIELRRRFGGTTVWRWEETSLGPDVNAPAGRSQEILRWRNVAGTATGMVLLTGAQSIAIRSSPHRPPVWGASSVARAMS